MCNVRSHQDNLHLALLQLELVTCPLLWQAQLNPLSVNVLMHEVESCSFLLVRKILEVVPSNRVLRGVLFDVWGKILSVALGVIEV